MAFYKQNAAQVVNRSPVSIGTGGFLANSTRSQYMYGPSAVLPVADSNTQWSQGGIFNAQPWMGGWDPLRGRIMHVAQTDFYNSAPVGMNSGVYDQPGAQTGVINYLRLEMTTSARPGLTMPTTVGPPMFFQAPPSQTVQAKPIFAIGL